MYSVKERLKKQKAQNLFKREGSVSLVGLKGEYVSSSSEQATITARHTVKWFYSGLGIKGKNN